MSGAFAAFGGGLHAALTLARGRPEGLARLVAPPADPAAVAGHSFWALAVCLPAFLLLDRLGDLGGGGAALALDTLGDLVAWLAFAVLSHALVGRFGRGALWWRFIAAWNWSNVAQLVLQLAAAGIGWMGAPDWVAETAWLVALGWAVWIEWYAARLTLAIPGLAAAGLVALDFAVSRLVLTAIDLAGS